MPQQKLRKNRELILSLRKRVITVQVGKQMIRNKKHFHDYQQQLYESLYKLLFNGENQSIKYLLDTFRCIIKQIQLFISFQYVIYLLPSQMYQEESEISSEQQFDIDKMSKKLNNISQNQKKWSQKFEKINKQKCLDQDQRQGMQCFTQVQDPTEKQILIHALTEIEKKQGVNIVFKEKSDHCTRMSMKIIGSNLHKNALQITEKLNLEDTPFTKQELESNKQGQDQFQQWYKIYCMDKYHLTPSGIKNIQCIKAKNQNQVTIIWRTDQGEKFRDALINNKSYESNISVKNIFQTLHFSTNDYFDESQDLVFTKEGLGAILERNDWPYYQPIIGKRFGIKTDHYSKDKAWMGRQGKPGQWVCASHGLGCAGDKIIGKNGKNISCLENILIQNFRPGHRQLYENLKAVNRDEYIDKGIYFTPHFQTALRYASPIQIKGQYYFLILQCRLRPQSILICPEQQSYWVVKDPKDIRCYGILVLNQKQAESLSLDPEQTHGHTFQWNKFKHQITHNYQDFDFID